MSIDTICIELIQFSSSPQLLVELKQPLPKLIANNQAANEITGFEWNSFLSYPIQNITHAEYQSALLSLVEKPDRIEINDLIFTAHRIGKGPKYVLVSIEKTPESTLKPSDESELNFQLIENLPSSLFVINQQGKILLWNKKFEEAGGYSKEEIATRTPLHFFDPSEHSLVQQHIVKAFTDGFASITIAFNTKNGHKLPYVFTARTITYKGELCILGSGVDISDKVATEQLLAQSEQRFKALVQEGSDLIGILNLQGEYIYVSPTSIPILGIAPEEFIGKIAFDFIHPEDKDQIMSHFSELENKKQIQLDPFRFRHQDGTWRWIESIITNLLDEPAVGGIVANSRDVTERENIMQELRTSQERYRGFYESQTNYVIRTDLEGNYSYCNDKFLDQFGWIYPEGIVLGVSSLSSICEYDHQKVFEVVAKCMAEPGRVFKIEIDKPAKENGPLTTLWDFVCLLDKNGQPSEMQCSGIDISDRIRFERALKKSNDRYELLNKATNDAIYDWDIRSDHFTWGEAFHRIFGYHQLPEPFSLANWVRLMHPEDVLSKQEDWDDFIRNPERVQWNNEFRFRFANGYYGFVEEIGHMIRDKEGKALRMIGVLRDKSQQKKEEHNRQVINEIGYFFKSGEPLQSIVKKILEHLANNGHFMIAELWMRSQVKEELHLYSYYTQTETLRGFYSPENLLYKLEKGQGMPGQVWAKGEITIWEEVSKHPHFLRKSAAAQFGINTALGLPIKHNHQIVAVLILATNHPADLVEPYGSYFESLQLYLGAEITRKKQEEELSAFFNYSPEILAIASPNGHFSKVNPAFCQLLGYSETEIIGRPFGDFLHPDDLKKTTVEYNETITGERTAKNFINRYRTINGNYRWISWSSSNVYDHDGHVFAYGRDVTERIELQQLLDNATELSRVGSWEVDLVNEKHYWSPMTRAIHGVSDGYMPNMETAINFYRPDIRQHVLDTIQNTMQTGAAFDFVLPIITAQGKERWVRSIGRGEFLEGTCIRLYGSFQDIHEHKMAQLALEKAFEERNTILESIGDAFFAVDTQWNVSYWNKVAEHLLNIPKATIIGKNLWKVFPDVAKLKSYNMYKKAMETREIVHFEYYYAPIDRWFEVSAYPSESGLSIYFKDVSLRKQAEKEIRASNERFEKATQATEDAIWDWDLTTDYLYLGKGFQTLFGLEFKPQESTIDTWSDCIHPLDREAVLQSLTDIIEHPTETNWEYEYRFKRKDGSYAYVVDRGIVIRNSKAVGTRMVGAMTDITSRKAYEQSLKELNFNLQQQAKALAISNAELEQFAYVASHDLQEPLRMVTSFLTQLEKKYKDKLDDKALQYIGFAVDGAKRMRQIILDLLEYSRVGKHEDGPEEIKLNELVEVVGLLLRKKIEETGGQLVYNQLPCIKSYKSPMLQVLQNLVDNALKYRHPDRAPYIQIEAQELNSAWQFSIRDNGLGIEPDYFDKIFIIFQRLHSKDEYKGTGMGLAVVKKIIENLGGKIWLESEPGKGSIFYFTIAKQHEK